MNLTTVTITGADDSVDPGSLALLSAKYPFVEWGILLSSTRVGTARYPSFEWISELHKHSEYLRLSGHVCGRWARDILERGEMSVKYECPEIWPLIKRLQINIKPTEITRQCIDALRLVHDKDIIIPVNEFDSSALNELRDSGVNCFPLFDKSGGRGVVPEDWIVGRKDILIGYAGGLGPDNFEEELTKIEVVANDCSVWVDMETKVRTDEAIFDLKKVEEVLHIAASHVSSSDWYKAVVSTPAGRKSAIP